MTELSLCTLHHVISTPAGNANLGYTGGQEQ